MKFRFFEKAGKILFLGIFCAVLLTGCIEVVQRTIDRNDNVSIRIEDVVSDNSASAARTLTPNTTSATEFERFELDFTNGAKTESLIFEKGQTIKTITLETGTWDISAFGFYKIGDRTYKAAEGSETVTVNASHTAASPANVTIGLKTGIFDGEPGVFTYNVGFPVETDEATLTINPFSLETAGSSSGKTVNLINEGKSNSFELDPGFHLLTLSAKMDGGIGEKGAAWSELVHIHSGQETVVNHNFTADDFVDPEQLVSTNSGDTPFMGLIADVSYDIVNLPLDGLSGLNNVMKVYAENIDWAAARYSLADYKDREITIDFSANVKRVGADGNLYWQVNNDGYPILAQESNAQSGTWYTMSGTETLTPTNANPYFYLDVGNSASTVFYIYNFVIDITVSPGRAELVEVSPETISIIKGNTQSFSATVTGVNSPLQTVDWTVTGGIAGTSISNGGVLTVAANETAESLTVRATSTVTPSVSGTATVTVLSRIVDSVTVSPGTATVSRGNSESFSATVTGTNDPATTVTWTVTGGIAGTSISNTGVLTVAAGETAGTLTVRATSTQDTSKYGEAVVTVVQPVVESVTVSPSSMSVLKGGTQQFSAVVNGANNPSQTVTWTVTGGIAGTSISNAGLLTVAADETADTLTVHATSQENTSISGTASVYVNAATGTVSGTITVTNGISSETVSLTNSGNLIVSALGTITVTVSGTYDAYRWLVDGVLVSGATGSSITLNGNNYYRGTHRLLVVVYKNGIPYSHEVSFTVN